MVNYRTPNVQRRVSNLWKGKMTYDQELVLRENFIPVHPPNTIPINFLPRGKGYNYLKRINDKTLLKTISQVVNDYKLKNYIFLNCFNPFYLGYLPKDFGQKLNIYQCIDDMTQEAYTAKHAYHLETEVIQNVDVAFVTSRQLYELKYPLNPQTHILNNAVDWNIFGKASSQELPIPPELKGVNGKIIGFTGNLNEYRVNYGLIRKLAIKHSDKTLVLVGPLNSNDYKDHGLDQMQNVILTGGKDINDLPNYLQHFDCLIIPFLCNKLTQSVYPLKINEYLSSGKPVISTNFSIDIKGFSEYIYIAEEEEEFLNKIDQALSEDDPQIQLKRIAIAKSNTWEARVQQFWEIIEPMIGSL